MAHEHSRPTVFDLVATAWTLAGMFCLQVAEGINEIESRLGR